MTSHFTDHQIISCPEQLQDFPGINQDEIKTVVQRYPLRINSYYMDLIRSHGEPLARQVIPDIRELNDPDGMDDPLDEENLSPVPNLVHKYPDRALFLVTNECAMYCRFCTRKRKVGTPKMVITRETINAGIEYLHNTPEIRDVLVSGGDPLILGDNQLEEILRKIREVKSVVTIRIGTRMPCAFPMRITAKLAGILRKYHPIYINTHFNHPAEVTAEAAAACAHLADAGIPLGCQTVLLRGINDSPEVMCELLYKLLKIRVKPYYLFQADLTRGTGHFRTTVETGISIMKSLIGHVSGMAIPTYALDAPGGGGKIPLTPDYIRSLGNTLDFTTYNDQLCSYPNYLSGSSCKELTDLT